MTELEAQLERSVNLVQQQKERQRMSSKAIVKQQAGGLSVAGPMSEWEVMRSQAKELLQSGFLPKSIRTPEQAIAIMQTGKELGLGPMQSLRGIHVIDGKPAMSADLIAGLALARVPGSTLRVVESTNLVCRVEAAREGHKVTPFSFSMDDAKAAGLTGKDVWRKYPRAMLRARCLTEACRAVFPDVVMGLYSPEELEDSSPGKVIDVQPFREGRDEAPALSLSPHSDSREEEEGDWNLFGDLLVRLENVKHTDIPACDSYDKALALRNVIGSGRVQSELLKRIQAGKESGALTGAMQAELGKLWQHCHRQVSKLEEKLKPALESSFVDEPEAPLREPGADEGEELL